METPTHGRIRSRVPGICAVGTGKIPVSQDSQESFVLFQVNLFRKERK